MANLLIDELQTEDKASTPKRDFFHTPEPLTAKMTQLCILDSKSATNKDSEESYSSKQRRELSRKRSLKASTKELQDLTNLIRKTKNSKFSSNGSRAVTPVAARSNNLASVAQSQESLFMSRATEGTLTGNIQSLMRRVDHLRSEEEEEIINDDSFRSNNKRQLSKIKSIKIITRSLYKEINKCK